MKTNLLFPHRYRLIGWLLFIPSAVLGLAEMYYDVRFSWLSVSISKEFTIQIGPSITNFFNTQNLTDEVAALGVIIGLLFIAFAKERVEDEMISRLRLEALQWSVYANYIILAIALLTVYEDRFLAVMIYNMFTVLLVFIARFRWLLYRNTQTLLAL